MLGTSGEWNLLQYSVHVDSFQRLEILCFWIYSPIFVRMLNASESYVILLLSSSRSANLHTCSVMMIWNFQNNNVWSSFSNAQDFYLFFQKAIVFCIIRVVLLSKFLHFFNVITQNQTKKYDRQRRPVRWWLIIKRKRGARIHAGKL